jgi:hypothetical protein
VNSALVGRRFTKSLTALKILSSRKTRHFFWLILQFVTLVIIANQTGALMAATGELIRLINYVDDITTTLRRISASIPVMDADERKKLAEHMRVATTNFNTLLAQLEKGS